MAMLTASPKTRYCSCLTIVAFIEPYLLRVMLLPGAHASIHTIGLTDNGEVRCAMCEHPHAPSRRLMQVADALLLRQRARRALGNAAPQPLDGRRRAPAAWPARGRRPARAPHPRGRCTPPPSRVGGAARRPPPRRSSAGEAWLFLAGKGRRRPPPPP